MMTFVRGVSAARRRSGSRSNPVASSVATGTGTAPTRRICSGYDTQYGLGTSTSSPGLSKATARLKSVCLAPTETRISAGSYSSALSRLNLVHTAARSSGIPPTSVYLVWPWRMAWTAASLMQAGGSTSGSPAPKEMTSTPRERRALALACTANVDEVASFFIRSASMIEPSAAGSGRRSGGILLGEALLHHGRHQPGHRSAEASHLPDQLRGDVRVFLVGHEEDGFYRARELAVHEGHLELVLEVRHRPDPAYDAVGALARDQIDGQAIERDDPKVVREIAGGLVDHLQPFLHREQWLLAGVGHNGHDQLVEDAETTLDDVQVAVVHGIEHPRIHGTFGHSVISRRRCRSLEIVVSGSKECQGRLPETARPVGAQGTRRR